MAEGFLRDLAGDRFEVDSAGYEPSAEVCADAVAVMSEIGIDISEQRPKPMKPFLGQRIAYAITVCERQKERSCPIFPGVVWRSTWPLEDPLTTTSLDERLAAVRQVRDEIRRRVIEFVSEHA